MIAKISILFFVVFASAEINNERVKAQNVNDILEEIHQLQEKLAQNQEDFRVFFGKTLYKIDDVLNKSEAHIDLDVLINDTQLKIEIVAAATGLNNTVTHACKSKAIHELMDIVSGVSNSMPKIKEEGYKKRASFVYSSNTVRHQLADVKDELTKATEQCNTDNENNEKQQLICLEDVYHKYYIPAINAIYKIKEAILVGPIIAADVKRSVEDGIANIIENIQISQKGLFDNLDKCLSKFQ